MTGGRDEPPAAASPAGEADGAGPDAVRGADPAETRSLIEDVEDLLADGQTWLAAELAYQKTRAGFVAAMLKSGVALAVVAGVLALLALVGLTVGLIIALSPLVTPWGATAIVVGVLLLVAFVLLRMAASRFAEMSAAMREKDGPQP